jgi:hypothetical protein
MIMKPEEIEDLRKGLGAILLNENYTMQTLAVAVGISYRALLRFMKGGVIRTVTELKIKRFVHNYAMLKKIGLK